MTLISWIPVFTARQPLFCTALYQIVFLDLLLYKQRLSCDLYLTPFTSCIYSRTATFSLGTCSRGSRTWPARCITLRKRYPRMHCTRWHSSLCGSSSATSSTTGISIHERNHFLWITTKVVFFFYTIPCGRVIKNWNQLVSLVTLSYSGHMTCVTVMWNLWLWHDLNHMTTPVQL